MEETKFTLSTKIIDKYRQNRVDKIDNIDKIDYDSKINPQN